MARMHSGKKGKSGSTKPHNKKNTWIRYTAKEAEQLIIKLAKAGNSKSVIGLTLRDSYGIPDTKTLTKKTIGEILEENKLSTELPEDFIALIKREIEIAKHMEKNKKDFVAKRGLQLTESKIKRLTKYYKRVGKLPEDWKYDREKVKLLVG
nr:30S ribosomal protein S15 [Candidatus Woesearchaeota archaeon]